MSTAREAFLRLAEQTMNFELLSAGDSPLPSGHTTGWRVLPCTVISHITGASMSLDLDDGSLTTRERAYCVTPGIHHRSSGVGGRCRWMHCNFTLFGGVNLFTFMAMPPILSRAVSDKAARINQQIAALSRDYSSIKACVQRKALGFQMLAALLPDATLRDDHFELAEGAQRLAPALMHVRENLSRRIPLGDLARRVHLSSSRFHAVFRRVFGISPSAYLQRERLRKAQELLIQSDLSIADVGASVGWDNPFFFSRLFRKRTGQTPMQYRRDVRSGIMPQ